MIRIARLTDYGLVLLTHMAGRRERSLFTTRDLAQETGIPLPTASKVLKTLAHAGLLESHRGVAGGYSLGRAPERISLAEIIDALEGPIAITLCSEGSGSCDLEHSCPDRGNWQRINEVIRNALGGITLAEMAQPNTRFLTLGARTASGGN